MDDANDDDAAAGDSKERSIVTVHEVPIRGPHQFVFGDQCTPLGKALQSGHLSVQFEQESIGGGGIVFRDERPDGFGVRLCSP